MALDDLIPEEWPPEVVAALNNWRQGHLLSVETGVWLGPAGVDDPVTRDSAPGNPGDLRARSDVFGDTGYMAVISQTCDIAVGGPGRRHPFVQACPIRNIAGFPRQKIEQIELGNVVEYVLLSQPPEAGAVWAVDLRVAVPVSKGVLAAAHPVEGFATEEDEILLSYKVADKFARPAVHDTLASPVFKSLRQFVSASKTTDTWCDDIEQVRLDIMEGTRLQPKRVRLIVYTDIKVSEVNRGPLRGWWKTQKRLLKQSGVEQSALRFRFVGDCPLKEYRESIPISVPNLDRGRFA
ncbi:hypothetical protein [Mycobacterium malmoense]|uniref:hypothetical protein n=1 Tax=Mycobacterium malmoense TaxID=1780 RepID=UPI00114D4E2D|nr:hypothetical protein [Mycobacterium malmoense]